MTGVISAEEGALRAGAVAVSTTKTGIETEVRKVRGEIEQLRGFWTGSAAGSFTNLMVRWDEQSTKLNNILLELEAALRGTESAQAADEDAGVQTITGLGALMN
ncbi:MAG: WXG100 family type VII secretion target [Microbacterium sp.]|uniref:WXG100 family type VII secretion target n=1 Tax=Microbacterium sp. TaxID=51671 RepID=UPI003F95F087